MGDKAARGPPPACFSISSHPGKYKIQNVKKTKYKIKEKNKTQNIRIRNKAA